MQDTLRRARASILDVPVTALFSVNLEGLLYLAIFLFTIATRFWDLGSRSYNHDESLHTLYSWQIFPTAGRAIHFPRRSPPMRTSAARCAGTCATFAMSATLTARSPRRRNPS